MHGDGLLQDLLGSLLREGQALEQQQEECEAKAACHSSPW
jgi:hypothetical protein